jgi:hypothetical protein
MVIAAKSIPATRLFAAKAPADAALLDPSSYEGRGVAITSSDRRFADIVAESAFGLRHRCGNIVYTPTGWNAAQLDKPAFELSFSPNRPLTTPRAPTPQLPPVPPLAGYRGLASWPLSNDTALGLMSPVSGAGDETLLVAFRPGGAKPLVVNRFSLPFQAISLLPDIHSSKWYVNLDGVGDHELFRVTLRLTQEQREWIAAHAPD